MASASRGTPPIFISRGTTSSHATASNRVTPIAVAIRSLRAEESRSNAEAAPIPAATHAISAAGPNKRQGNWMYRASGIESGAQNHCAAARG